MSYKLLSNKTGSDHDIDQWQTRSLEGELEAFKGRTLLQIFSKYINGHSFNIIEAGCGLGAWCEWFQRRNHSVIGIEYDPHVVLKAKSAKPDIPVEAGNINNLRFADNTFDAYISLGVIEHFEQGPEKALAEAFRVLKPGGLGFFSTPLLTPFRRFVTHPIRNLYFIKQKLSGEQSHFWEYRFSKKELRNYLEQAGFRVIDEGIDDYCQNISNRHLGIWADWFFFRNPNNEIWSLNTPGRLLLKFLKLFPEDWYCAGYIYVVEANK